jgi:WD40 repeat protein
MPPADAPKTEDRRDKPGGSPAEKKVDPAQTRMVLELKHTSPLIGCRFDATGRFVFAGAQESAVQRWELATSKKTTLAAHKSWVRALASAPDGKLLFTGGYDGQVIAWPTDTDNPAPQWTISAHKGWVRALAVSPDGKTLASCGNDNLVKLWSAADGKPLRELAGHLRHVYNVAFHPNGQALVSGDLMGVLKQWDMAKGTAEREFDGGVLHKYDEGFGADIGGVRGMAFSGDGGLLACAGITEVSNAFAGVGKPVVALFDWPTGKRKQLLIPKDPFQGTAWGVCFHPDGFVIGAGGGNGGALWFWKPEQAQAFVTLKLPANARDLALHPDGKRLAVACQDGAVRIYEMTAK